MSTLQFDKIYARLNTLNERIHGLIELILLFKGTPDRLNYHHRVAIHQAEMIILSLNQEFEEVWTQWMQGMLGVAEVYMEHMKRNNLEKEAKTKNNEKNGEKERERESGVGRMLRKMGSRASIRFTGF